MSNIISTGTACGKYTVAQKDIKEFTYNLFSGNRTDIDRLISVFDNSHVERRHISVPIEWLRSEHTFPERNEIFIKEAVALVKIAIKECLDNAGISAVEIDNIIFVTSTGIATPTIDAILFNELKLNSHIKRTPLWGLGCAGGAAGISNALQFTRAYPSKTCLVAAVELCSLTFQKDDLSKSNVIAASLFSDGAAAVLVTGEESKINKANSLKLIDSFSTIYDDTLDIMGWEIVDDGFKVRFSRDIPAIVKEKVHGNILEFLNSQQLKLDDIKHYVTHPGGLKVINAYEESLNLKQGSLNYSRKVLKENGNMSSPSVIFVLDEFLRNSVHKNNEMGLISSLGPGFSSELVLFKTA
jgi:alkylresorcinol/alkylpyrone synthase